MRRREFVTAAAATAVLPLVTGSHRRRDPRPRVDGDPERWTALEESYDLGGPFPIPGASDGPVAFIRSTSSWQNGLIVAFQSHANGNCYRHHGDSLEDLAPGTWVHGPGEGQRYSTINSVLRDSDGSLYGFTHNETPGDIASCGVVKSDENGYVWERLTDTAVEGQELLADGFRGASGPSVVERGGVFHMFYTNRFGNGRHTEVWDATAPHPEGPWTVQGPVIVESGDHFFAAGATVVWSEPNGKWMLVYSTAEAVRYCLSSDLSDWSPARTLMSKPNEWTQQEGFWRFYACLLDESKDSSMVVGRDVKMAEHWIRLKGWREMDVNVRYPMLTDVEIR